jgi:hypothetical protein
VELLKSVLDHFAAATGLKINYNKSTMVPMHADPGVVAALQGILSCQVGAFPQTYLGLPLSNSKLRMSAFAPLIYKTDKYLAGWQVTLLNPMGRMVLVNTVLNSQLIYAMFIMLLPQGTIDTVDHRRRAFLWSGDEHVSGAQCLVAWEKVCQEKGQGGLGVKDLAAENKCLLLKLLHRLHNPGESACARPCGPDDDGRWRYRPALEGPGGGGAAPPLPRHHHLHSRRQGRNLLLGRLVDGLRSVEGRVPPAP